MKSRKKRSKEKKSKTSTFLKDPLESVIVHLGNVINNAAPKDLVEAGLTLGLAAIGGQTYGYPHGLLVGPIALKLATTQGGGGLIPSPSQVAGLAMLGHMGLNLFLEGQPTVDEPDRIDPKTANQKEFPRVDEVHMECVPATFGQDRLWHCPEGYTFHQYMWGNVVCCKDKEPEPQPSQEWTDLVETPQEGWCTTHLKCGTTICSFNVLTVQIMQTTHVCPTPSNGVE